MSECGDRMAHLGECVKPRGHDGPHSNGMTGEAAAVWVRASDSPPNYALVTEPTTPTDYTSHDDEDDEPAHYTHDEQDQR